MCPVIEIGESQVQDDPIGADPGRPVIVMVVTDPQDRWVVPVRFAIADDHEITHAERIVWIGRSTGVVLMRRVAQVCRVARV